MTLGERLKEAMKGPPRVTQLALARACGVTQPTVSEWISGETKTIKGQLLVKVAAHLNVSPDWLVSGKGQRARDSSSQSQPARLEPHTMFMALQWLDFDEAEGGPYKGLDRPGRLIEIYEMLEAAGGSLTPQDATMLISAATERRKRSGVDDRRIVDPAAAATSPRQPQPGRGRG